MTDTEFSYQRLSFTDFFAQYGTAMPKARLFELSLPWLTATNDFMVESTDSVIVHCLISSKQGVVIAWPLVHQQNKRIKSLTSFYSAISEPLYFVLSNEEHLCLLLGFIEQDNNWQTMQFGSFDKDSVTAKALVDFFPFCKIFSRTDNIYQQVPVQFDEYYQQRPSQLRNTIKRRSKKLAKLHSYNISIVTELAGFSTAFSAYKTIYQQSWKGEEYSFAFIEQVCLSAIDENKLRLGLLTIDGKPAAAQIWFVQSCPVEEESAEKNASIFKLAYNPEYQMFSVGSLLSMALSEHVITQDQVTSIEFGMGSEPYKMDWLNNKRQRTSYQVFNPLSFYGKLDIIRHIILPKIRAKLFSKT